MDMVTKVFLYLGSLIGASLLIAALFALSTAENGQLTVEGLSHLEAQFSSFYDVFKWVIFAWLPFAAIMLFRLIRGIFR
jgi:hypothetical protein